MMSAMRMTEFVSVVSAKMTMSAMREIRLSVKCVSVSVCECCECQNYDECNEGE